MCIFLHCNFFFPVTLEQVIGDCSLYAEQCYNRRRENKKKKAQFFTCSHTQIQEVIETNTQQFNVFKMQYFIVSMVLTFIARQCYHSNASYVLQFPCISFAFINSGNLRLALLPS